MCCILVKYSSKIENTVESSNIGYSIGCFLMQGLLLVVWGYLILTEQLCRGSVVSLEGEALAPYSVTACVRGIWRELQDQGKGSTKHLPLL